MESYVKNSLVGARDGEVIFSSMGDGPMTARLDGYVVLPIESMLDPVFLERLGSEEYSNGLRELLAQRSALAG